MDGRNRGGQLNGCQCSLKGRDGSGVCSTVDESVGNNSLNKVLEQDLTSGSGGATSRGVVDSSGDGVVSRNQSEISDES